MTALGVAAAVVLLTGCGTPAGQGRPPAPPPASASPAGSAPATTAPSAPAAAAARVQGGPGWALAEFTTGTATAPAQVTLDMIDPAGHVDPVYRWADPAQPWTLAGWSGDRSRVLLLGPAGKVGQLTIATGTFTTFTVPAGARVLGYTRPDGEAVLVSGKEGLARYSLTGVLQQRLSSGSQYPSAISAPDGLTEVVSATTGLEVVSNAGGVVRKLPVTGAGAAGSCTPERWWNTTDVLATCPAGSGGATQLWLVPAGGGTPSALTPPRTGGAGPDLGDIDAWYLAGSGLYVDATDGCGSTYIARQGTAADPAAVSVPASAGDNRVVVTSGAQMLVLEHLDGCGPRQSLVWFDPATGAVQDVLAAPASGDGVTSVIAFDADGTQS